MPESVVVKINLNSIRRRTRKTECIVKSLEEDE